MNYEKAINMLQNDICNAVHWFSENCLKINSRKTKLFCFRNPLKTTVINAPVYIHDHQCTTCECAVVNYVDSIKYLGIAFDSALSWHEHLAYICGKLRSVACVLYNIKSFVPFHVMKSIARALAYSVLRYGITIFYFCSPRWKAA